MKNHTNDSVMSSILHCNKVSDIADPLFDLLPEVKIFSYSRVYPTGTRLDLSSNYEMANMLINTYKDSARYNLYSLLKPVVKDIMIVSEWLKSLSGEALEFYRAAFRKEQDAFNLSDEICVVTFSDSYIEIFHFYSSREVADPINFFISHRTTLKQFALKFAHDAKDLIDKEEQKINQKKPTKKYMSLNQVGFTEENALPALLPRKFYLKDRNGGYLTSAELKCGIEALNGKSNQQVADAIGISVRTVEVYMESMRKKIGCDRRSGVIQYLLEHSMNAYVNLDTLSAYNNR